MKMLRWISNVLKLGETTKRNIYDIYEMHYTDTEQISAGSSLPRNWAVALLVTNSKAGIFSRYLTDWNKEL